MFLIDGLILISGVLILLGIASSKLSARMGVPVLVLFLSLGMLAGSEGIGGLAFENYALAHGIGTVALVLILFDGGLGTSLDSVRAVWKPALALATIGVLVTSILTAAAAMLILKFTWWEGLLLGSIVGSTDAAAVFAVLRLGGVSLPHKLVSTIEIESGSNDPMAVFMTVGCIEILTGEREFGLGLLTMFLSEMIIGAIVGIGIGLLTVHIVNRINLGAAGLYPVLVTAFSLLTFGLTAWLEGSGFLAVYIAGIVIGNSRLVFQRGIRLFHDAIAWLVQIVMFIVLGLLSFPHRLLQISLQGLLIGAVLILIARPLAVALSLFAFRFSWRELALIAWVGLRGAVPITLATFPLLLGAPRAELIFDVTFFVVVVSALVQGWSLPPIARWLALIVPEAPTPPLSLEISSLRHVDGDIVDYTITDQSRAAGRAVKDLALPDGVVIALISRNEQIIPPQGNTAILAGDHVILVLRPSIRPVVDRIFSNHGNSPRTLPSQLEFPLRPTIAVRELEEMYAIALHLDGQLSLAEAVKQQVPNNESLADKVVDFGPISLHVRKLSEGGEIEQLSMLIHTVEESAEAEPPGQSHQAVPEADPLAPTVRVEPAATESQ